MIHFGADAINVSLMANFAEIFPNRKILPWQYLRDGVKSLDFIEILGWKYRIYTLFTPLEDRMNRKDVR